MLTLEEGQIFERYFIIRWLGSGVSGESYEAKDVMLQHKVTLKLIHPWAILEESARRQFFREMQGISRLSHPYLASVLDYGETNDRLYVARRYTTSGSLLGSEGRSWFPSPMSISDAIRYGHQLAQTLEHVHRQDYLHGALTFANILVLRGPNVEHEPDYAPFLLADIGLTNFVRRYGQPQISLLPITAAPEQLGKRVTPASDQFALAVLLFCWLAGRPPYLGSPDEVEHLKLTETIAPLRPFNPQVTDEQEAILRRALAVYPEERYPSILAFADALAATITPPSMPDALAGPNTTCESTTQPQPVPEPTPPAPDIPLPLPNPIPPPPPEPRPAPAPEPSPAPTPEPTPPAPDIPLPLPDPAPITEPMPEIPPAPETAESPSELASIPESSAAAYVASSTPESSTRLEFLLEPLLAPNLASAISLDAAIPARFVITSPYTEQQWEVILEGDELTLGRAGSSDILLDYDAQISRHHALLKHEDDHYVIYDRRSVSGVFVNGQKLVGDAGYALSDGDHVRIGCYELIYRAGVYEGAREKNYLPNPDLRGRI